MVSIIFLLNFASGIEKFLKRRKIMSPKFKEINGFVFKIYSNEESRIHIHIVKAENEAKYWLEPDIELVENFGFSSKELSFIEKILKENGDDFKIKFARHTGKRLDD
mgnify:FL=1